MSMPLLFTADANALARHGWQASQVGRHDVGARALRMAVTIDADNGQAWIALGVVYTRQQRWRDALLAFAEASVLAPERLDAWLYYAEAALELNAYGEAAYAIESCVALDPDMKTAEGTRARLLAVKAHKRLLAAGRSS